MVPVAASLLLVAHLVTAAPAAAGKGTKAAPATARPVAAPAATPALPDPATLTTPALVALARQQYEALEYDRVARLAELALARADVRLDDKLVAYALQGSALAIVADPIDAEKPFRLLLRARPDFDLPATTPPKILAVFRKVQVEERAIVEEVAQLQRQRLIATLKLDGVGPVDLRGGRPARFAYRLRDPQGAVESVRVQYRRQGERDFTSLPLKRSDSGAWTGRIPGEWTASDAGFALEYFVVAGDDRGALLSIGDAKAPSVVPVAAGAIDKNAHPVPAWGFWLAAGATGAAGTTAAALAAATAWQNFDYHDKLARAAPEAPADGADLVRQAELGTGLMIAQFVGWGVAGLGAVVTGVLTPFTAWTEEAPDDHEDADGPAAAAPAAGR